MRKGESKLESDKDEGQFTSIYVLFDLLQPLTLYKTKEFKVAQL